MSREGREGGMGVKGLARGVGTFGGGDMSVIVYILHDIWKVTVWKVHRLVRWGLYLAQDALSSALSVWNMNLLESSLQIEISMKTSTRWDKPLCEAKCVHDWTHKNHTLGIADRIGTRKPQADVPLMAG